MASQKPPEPREVLDAKSAPSSHGWLFLFYKWITSALANMVSAAVGQIFYSDGVGGLASEAAFTYTAGTDTLNVVNINCTGYASFTEITDPGFATANQAWLHAEDVSGITQIHHNTSTHKWTIGQDNWIVARNVTGGSIPALRAVYVSGSTGQRPQITMADADLHHHALGVTQDTIADNGYGAVVMSGYVKSVDTSGWVAGDALFISGTAGVLTNSAPAFPATKQRVATVIFAHATQGIIQVFHHEDERGSDGAWTTPWTIGDGTTAGEIRFLEAASGGGTNYTGFKAPSSLAGNVVYTMPTADAAKALVSDGAGTLSWSNVDHGSQLTGLADDDHTQYALLAGRSGGQVLTGGTGSGDDLTLRSTSNATKGDIIIADEGGNVIIGGGATASRLRLMEASGSGTNYTEFVTQPQAANVTYTLPADDGTANQVLTTDGSGGLSWATAGSGSDATPMTPQGRVTLTTATPVMSSEAANQTTVYYTPYVGDIVPIYNGSSWTNTTFTELSIAMAASANWAANSNFDLFVFSDSGTLRLVTGPAWTSGTGRGTGAGTTELERKNGIWTNKVSMTGRYGASSTLTVGANNGTYVGTLRTTGSTGTTTWELGGTAAGGDPILLYLWNCYNRVRLGATSKDSTDSWSYTTGSWRSQNNSASNRASFLRGMNEDAMFGIAKGEMTTSSAGANIGIGLDSTSAFSGLPQWIPGSATGDGIAQYFGQPGLGFHYLQNLEYGGAGVTFYGDSSAPATFQTGMFVDGMF